MLSVSPVWWHIEPTDALTRHWDLNILYTVPIVANVPITEVQGHYPFPGRVGIQLEGLA